MCCHAQPVAPLLVQVAALWPGDPYRAHWLLTADGHIAGLDTTPERLVLERCGRQAGLHAGMQAGRHAQRSNAAACLMCTGLNCSGGH